MLSGTRRAHCSVYFGVGFIRRIFQCGKIIKRIGFRMPQRRRGIVAPFALRRNGVAPGTSQRIAAQNAPRRKQRAFCCAVDLDRLHRILRTARRKAAVSAQQGRDPFLITFYKKNKKALNHGFCPAAPRRRPAALQALLPALCFSCAGCARARQARYRIRRSRRASPPKAPRG